MKEHPILFTGEMVRTILDGRKTQTRRAIKPQPEYRENESVPGSYGVFFHGWNLNHRAFDVRDIFKYCPYGKPGDRLWVRESFGVGVLSGKCADIRYRADNSIGLALQTMPHRYRKSDPINKWRPSIHMPRWASRILLEVTDVRVERVEEIIEGDAIAEGIQSHSIQVGKHYNPQPEYVAFPEKEGGFTRATEAFESLWDSINAKRGFGWDMNPWVWVVEFKRV